MGLFLSERTKTFLFGEGQGQQLCRADHAIQTTFETHHKLNRYPVLPNENGPDSATPYDTRYPTHSFVGFEI
ncbi:unnamed protein product [Pseudo-nitzschia multistriata]|uniref:Uncharacterized protein n=1 Tax=Pseudo-nitzschia multistriata TaxID=183589 RepID=A0A448Z3C9_9STRA|nr:unnamed protein product [Pseudo-nitzschia multistriata]